MVVSVLHFLLSMNLICSFNTFYHQSCSLRSTQPAHNVIKIYLRVDEIVDSFTTIYSANRQSERQQEDSIENHSVVTMENKASY